MDTPRQMLTLDVGRRDASRQVVYLGEGDVNGTMLIVLVTEDGAPFGCDGYTPHLMVPIRDGVMYRQEGTAAGNVVTITVDESGLGNIDGRIPGAYISLEAEDGTMTSTQRFDVSVAKSGRESVAPDTFATDIESINARLSAIEAALGLANQDEGGDDTGGDAGGDDTGGDDTDIDDSGNDGAGDTPGDGEDG